MTNALHPAPLRGLPWVIVRKTAVAVAGLTVMLAGVAMLVLPGPGIVTILAGLAILGTEFPWAKRLVQQIARFAKTAIAKIRNKPKTAE